MDLWIISQDRKSIVKPIDILLENPLNSGETGIRGYFSNNSYKMLGYYKTEERALEVLDEIQNMLHSTVIKQTVDTLHFESKKIVVYEMPKE